MFKLDTPLPVPVFDTKAERREYEAGREAQRNGLDYFDRKHYEAW